MQRPTVSQHAEDKRLWKAQLQTEHLSSTEPSQSKANHKWARDT